MVWSVVHDRVGDELFNLVVHREARHHLVTLLHPLRHNRPLRCNAEADLHLLLLLRQIALFTVTLLEALANQHPTLPLVLHAMTEAKGCRVLAVIDIKSVSLLLALEIVQGRP